jgi:hypothetical protein
MWFLTEALLGSRQQTVHMTYHTTNSFIPERISRMTLYASSGLASLSSVNPRDSMLRDSISRASISSLMACQYTITEQTTHGLQRKRLHSATREESLHRPWTFPP